MGDIPTRSSFLGVGESAGSTHERGWKKGRAHLQEKGLFLLANDRLAYYTESMEWNDRFMQLLTDTVYRFHEQAHASADHFFLPEETDMLASIGYTPHEMFGYIEDYATQGDPSPATILLIAAARRAYFLTVQRGRAGGAALLKEKDLPREAEEFQDIAYLPRIIRKAEAKLYGTLPPDVMYYCAKDRQFLRSHGSIHPADFLYVVWGAHGDKQKVVAYVLKVMKDSAEAAGQPTRV